VLTPLLSNSRKTECGAKQFLIRLEVRVAPFALLSSSRKTECGANPFLNRLKAPHPLRYSAGERSQILPITRVIVLGRK